MPEVDAEPEASTEVKTSKEELLKSLTTETSALMLRKCIREAHNADEKQIVFATLVDLLGEDQEPLPATPPFVDVHTRMRGRGRGRNLRGGRGGRGRGRGRPNSRGQEYGGPRESDTNSKPSSPLDLGRPPVPRESMQEFFAEIENLPNDQRNKMIQTCIQELITENKVLREANRTLSHKARLTDAPQEFVAQGKSIKSTPMNVNAEEFKMRPDEEKSEKNAHIKELRYQDFVQMRRQEQSYEEMIAEQMYLEELEMRRYHESYDEYGADPYVDYYRGDYGGDYGPPKRGFKRGDYGPPKGSYKPT